MTAPARNGDEQAMAVPPIVDHDTWETALAGLRAHERAAARELDAIAAARPRLPVVELPDHTLRGPTARSAWSRIHPGPRLRLR